MLDIMTKIKELNSILKNGLNEENLHKLNNLLDNTKIKDRKSYLNNIIKKGNKINSEFENSVNSVKNKFLTIFLRNKKYSSEDIQKINDLSLSMAIVSTAKNIDDQNIKKKTEEDVNNTTIKFRNLKNNKDVVVDFINDSGKIIIDRLYSFKNNRPKEKEKTPLLKQITIVFLYIGWVILATLKIIITILFEVIL